MSIRGRREDLLENFVQTKEYSSKSSLSEAEIIDMNFTKKNSDLLTEVMKTLIKSYCADNTEHKINRDMNTTIKAGVERDN